MPKNNEAESEAEAGAEAQPAPDAADATGEQPEPAVAADEPVIAEGDVAPAAEHVADEPQPDPILAVDDEPEPEVMEPDQDHEEASAVAASIAHLAPTPSQQAVVDAIDLRVAEMTQFIKAQAPIFGIDPHALVEHIAGRLHAALD